TDTEIDWETYIYQLELYLKGERDYSLITGPTGPIVYPAGHVHIHHAIFRLTDSGTNLKAGQQIYAAFKRLHSIFVLRLFMDCWMTVFANAEVLAYMHAFDLLGTVLRPSRAALVCL
ncbi:hypothetical protein FOMPIDRAFT_42557, partial [Fomitopsis schrenkii]